MSHPRPFVRVGEELVDGWHDLRGSVADELSDSVLRVLLALCEVIEHPGGSVLFGDSDFWVGADVSYELHPADADRYANSRKKRVHLGPDPSASG